MVTVPAINNLSMSKIRIFRSSVVADPGRILEDKMANYKIQKDFNLSCLVKSKVSKKITVSPENATICVLFDYTVYHTVVSLRWTNKKQTLHCDIKLDDYTCFHWTEDRQGFQNPILDS